MTEYYAKPYPVEPGLLGHKNYKIASPDNSAYPHHDAPQVLPDQDVTGGPQPLPGHGEADTAKYVREVEEGGRNGVNGNAHGVASRRTICGIGVTTLVIVVIAIICVLAAAIGGGVGGSMATRKCEREVETLKANAASLSPSSTISGSPSGSRTTSSGSSNPTTSAEPGAGENVGQVAVPKSKCPEVNGTLYTYTFGRQRSVTFRRVCNTVMDGGGTFSSQFPKFSSPPVAHLTID